MKLYDVMVIINLMPIAFILISISLTGSISAENTNELYMTDYILFEQKDYFIVLPVKKLPNDLTSNRVTMQSTENKNSI